MNAQRGRTNPQEQRMTRSESHNPSFLACASFLALATLAAGNGCEDPSISTPPAVTAPIAQPQAADAIAETKAGASAAEQADPQLDQGANSVYGKAMERAKKLEEEVAEYQRKLGEAADGKFPK